METTQNGPGEPCKPRPNGKRRFRPKTKTGCHTCRVRRVKCDEAKPSCNRCLSTGRVCDGYTSIFQVVTVGPSPPTVTAEISPPASLSIYQPGAFVVSLDEINSLADSFHAKYYRHNIGYHAEARAILAKLSDPAIRHALVSLQSLHHEFDARQQRYRHDDGNGGLVRIHHGLDAYNTSVTSLASRLGTSPTHESVCAALLCCQMFISIETMLGNYTAGMRHFIYGLRIMHQYRARPTVNPSGQLEPCNVPLPALDCFLIKLFASGRPDAKPMPINRASDTDKGLFDISLQEQSRGELAALSSQVLQFLDQVSRMQTSRQVKDLEVSKAHILARLESWDWVYTQSLKSLMYTHKIPAGLKFGAIFTLLLHGVLKVVVSLAMSSSPADLDKVNADFQNLTDISNAATEAKRAAAGRVI
ncbi:unnamed protein product [Clonostachys rosea f. rosea IK726]|uniref:Uncharacterized protein n=1 Tax=Clonostachys rosea f. rosea IK726 TaxID=1349383 RepID=A0ACA9TY31_BIOOC|nr:unnamed protein product [Clonostachys rosea f. rosea IK726]